MFGDKWNSKQYPDGCPSCPEGQRFKRRHAGRGFCSTHYQLDLKDEKLRAAKAVAVEAEQEARIRDLHGHENGTARDVPMPQVEEGEATYAPNCGDEFVPMPTGEELPSFRAQEAAHRAAVSGADAESIGRIMEAVDSGHPPPPMAEACCGDPAECDRPCVPRGKWMRDEEIKAESESCAAGCCEPSAERAAAISRMELHAKIVRRHFDALVDMEAALAVYNEHACIAVETASEADEIAAGLFDSGVQVAMGIPMLEAGNMDPEIRAMYALRDALDPLDRGAQIRVMRWAAGRFGIDRPLSPEDQA